MSKKDISAKNQVSVNKQLVIGIDFGDQYSYYCILNPVGEVIEESRVRTTPEAFTARFTTASARIAIEVGSHSQWISRLLDALGHEVLVADVRKIPGITASNKKSDRNAAYLEDGLGRPNDKPQSPMFGVCSRTEFPMATSWMRKLLVGSRRRVDRAVA